MKDCKATVRMDIGLDIGLARKFDSSSYAKRE